MPTLQAAADPLPYLGHRVVLRRLAAADLADFQAYRHDEALGRYQGWTPQADPEALAFIEQLSTAPLFQPGEWFQLAIAERDTDQLIGDIGVCVAAGESEGQGQGEPEAEIGFTLAAPSQGRGLAVDAVRAVIALLFEHTAVACVVGVTDARNLPSMRLMERLGMQRVATTDTVFRGGPCTEHRYRISRHDGAMDTAPAVPTTRYDGGCTCRSVRYRLITKPLFVHCCHCRWCQRETGSAFALNAMIEADRMQALQGDVEVVDTPSNSGKGQKISRCPSCRVAVWSNYAGAGDAVRFVRVGTLDEPDRLPPDVHIFTASKQPWVLLPPGTPAVAEYYKASELWPQDSLQRRAVLLARPQLP